MSIKDLIKKSIIENYTNTTLSVKEMIMLLLMSVCIGIFIYFIYKVACKNGFYSKAFNVSLIVMPIITATIIITIQESIVVSLGMVGALSIVRFRTALKNPLDLIFMFWSISVGIVVGAGLPLIAVVLSIVVAIVLLFFSNITLWGGKMLLNIATVAEPKDIEAAVKSVSGKAKRKSITYNGKQTNILFEIGATDVDSLFDSLKANDKVLGISIIENEERQF